MLDGGQTDRLESRLRHLIKADHDSVRIYPLCASCRGAVRHLGRGKPTEIPTAFIV